MISALRHLSDEAWAVADGSADGGDSGVSTAYTMLRERANELNAQHNWASLEEFTAMFPTFDQQVLIERLDSEIGAQSTGNEGGQAVSQLLRNLAHWAAAVALATEEAGDLKR